SYREVFAGMAGIKFRWMLTGLTALLVTGIIMFAVLRPKELHRVCVAGCVGTMGFTLMALEVLLLLGFQAIYGYVYQQLALLVAAVMMGMALGSWLGLRIIGQRDGGNYTNLCVLAMVQVIAALSPLLLYGFFLICARSNSQAALFLVGEVLFPVAGLLCGMLGGYQFPLASDLFFAGRRDASRENTGSLYAVDLLGACIGAVILSAYLVPLFGFLKAAMLILVLNLATALLAFMVASREKMLAV
ncbi:MAG: hypothetical protein P4M04_11085, partial [Acidobacteriota bacterium]|nr:hypothetical protein [Acidobacteriota bacterium]